MFTTTGQETKDYLAQLQRTMGPCFPLGVNIANKRTGLAHWDKNLKDWTTPGKASWLHQNNCAFMVDDSSDICTECESCGLRAYRIQTSKERHRGYTVYANVRQVLDEVERQLKSDAAFFYVDTQEPQDSWPSRRGHR